VINLRSQSSTYLDALDEELRAKKDSILSSTNTLLCENPRKHEHALEALRQANLAICHDIMTIQIERARRKETELARA